MAFLVGINMKSDTTICLLLSSSIKFYSFKHDEILSAYLNDINAKTMWYNNDLSSYQRNLADKNYYYSLKNSQLSPSDITTIILSGIYNKLKTIMATKDDVGAVITVPATFFSLATLVLITSAKRAGFTEVKVVKEPMAILIQYFNRVEFHKQDGIFVTVAFSDNYLDLGVIEVTGNNYQTLEIGGDQTLGSNDFIRVIIKMIEDEIFNNELYGCLDLSWQKIDENSILQKIFGTNERYWLVKQRIMQAAKQAMYNLRYDTKAIINLPALYQMDEKSIDFAIEITLDDFKMNVSPLLYRFKQALLQIHKAIDKKIVKVIASGDLVNLSIIKDIIADVFKQEIYSYSYMQEIANGAALLGEQANKINLINKLPYHIGVGYGNTIYPLLEKGSIYPPEIVKTKYYAKLTPAQTSLYCSSFEGNILNNLNDKRNLEVASFKIGNLKSLPIKQAVVSLMLSVDEAGVLHIDAHNLFDRTNSYHNIKEKADINGTYVMTFGMSRNLIGNIENDQFKPIRYNSLINYGDYSAEFYSRIKITNHDVVVGNGVKNIDKGIYIDDVGAIFHNYIHSLYYLSNEIYTGLDIVKQYFDYIKAELVTHQVIDKAMVLVVPYDYTSKEKKLLIDILNSLSYQVRQLVEEPVAGYLGYLNQSKQNIKEQDCFMFIKIEDKLVQVSIFNVHYQNAKVEFELVNEVVKKDFNFNNLLRAYFVKAMKIENYASLSNGYKELLDNAIDDLILDCKNRKNDRSILYIGLLDAEVEYEEEFSKVTFNKLLEDLGVFKYLDNIIMDNLRQSNLLLPINCLIYAGNISNIYGIQEKINSYLNINQEIMVNVNELLCLGGALGSTIEYKINNKEGI